MGFWETVSFLLLLVMTCSSPQRGDFISEFSFLRCAPLLLEPLRGGGGRRRQNSLGEGEMDASRASHLRGSPRGDGRISHVVSQATTHRRVSAKEEKNHIDTQLTRTAAIRRARLRARRPTTGTVDESSTLDSTEQPYARMPLAQSPRHRAERKDGKGDLNDGRGGGWASLGATPEKYDYAQAAGKPTVQSVARNDSKAAGQKKPDKPKSQEPQSAGRKTRAESRVESRYMSAEVTRALKARRSHYSRASMMLHQSLARVENLFDLLAILSVRVIPLQRGDYRDKWVDPMPFYDYEGRFRADLMQKLVAHLEASTAAMVLKQIARLAMLDTTSSCSTPRAGPLKPPLNPPLNPAKFVNSGPLSSNQPLHQPSKQPLDPPLDPPLNRRLNRNSGPLNCSRTPLSGVTTPDSLGPRHVTQDSFSQYSQLPLLLSEVLVRLSEFGVAERLMPPALMSSWAALAKLRSRPEVREQLARGRPLQQTYALVKQGGEGAEEFGGEAKGEEGEQLGRQGGAKRKHTNVNVGEKEGGKVIQAAGTERYVRKEEGGKCVRKGEGEQCHLELKAKELKAPYTEQSVLKGETEQCLYGGEVKEEEYVVACTGSTRGEGDSCVCALAEATCDELTLMSLTDRQCASLLVYIGVLYAADTSDARKGLSLRRPPPLLRTLARILRRLAEKEALQGFDAGQVLRAGGARVEEAEAEEEEKEEGGDGGGDGRDVSSRAALEAIKALAVLEWIDEELVGLLLQHADTRELARVDLSACAAGVWGVGALAVCAGHAAPPVFPYTHLPSAAAAARGSTWKMHLEKKRNKKTEISDTGITAEPLLLHTNLNTHSNADTLLDEDAAVSAAADAAAAAHSNNKEKKTRNSVTGHTGVGPADASLLNADAPLLLHADAPLHECAAAHTRDLRHTKKTTKKKGRRVSDAAWSSGRELGVVRRELAAGAAGVAGRATVSDAAWIGGRELGVLRGVVGCGCAGEAQQQQQQQQQVLPPARRLDKACKAWQPRVASLLNRIASLLREGPSSTTGPHKVDKKRSRNTNRGGGGGGEGGGGGGGGGEEEVGRRSALLADVVWAMSVMRPRIKLAQMLIRSLPHSTRYALHRRMARALMPHWFPLR